MPLSSTPIAFLRQRSEKCLCLILWVGEEHMSHSLSVLFPCGRSSSAIVDQQRGTGVVATSATGSCLTINLQLLTTCQIP